MENQRQRGNPIGPTGKTVAANVGGARRVRGMSLQQLSDRLAELGHKITVSGLSKIENEDRRVEVDDLVAIALALNVSPLGLLLPGRPTPEEEARVTGAHGSVSLFWRWALTEFSPDGDERGLAAHSLPPWLTELGADVKLPKNSEIEFFWGYGDGEVEHVETHRTF